MKEATDLLEDLMTEDSMMHAVFGLLMVFSKEYFSFRGHLHNVVIVDDVVNECFFLGTSSERPIKRVYPLYIRTILVDRINHAHPQNHTVSVKILKSLGFQIKPLQIKFPLIYYCHKQN